MPNPADDGRPAGAAEELMRRIPGFHGYLERAYRRESDALLRTHLAERLQCARKGLDGIPAAIADSAQSDSPTQLACTQARLDAIIARLRGPMRGYSGVFDLVRIGDNTLDAIYCADLLLSDKIEAAVKRVNARGAATPTAAAFDEMLALLDEAERACEKRDEILKGLI
ncbi:MAG TPA: hypothetical protein VHC19_10120 [Pirellulales bacterium]|jgi:hypothetical protein|nr:hypothetical protein [Pirellulales bacterium]